MLETLKALILDFQETSLPTSSPRHLAIKALPGKASICIGVRRCGKSTYLFQIMQKLLDQGIPRRNILYINFFDDRLHGLQQSGVGLVAEAYYSLFPEKKGAETVYCFFDEIQSIPLWESFVDRLMRTEKCEVYLSGSSAQMLSTEIATQMRGRALSWELFPFSFREFLDFRKIDGAPPYSTKRRLLIQKAFEEYWQSGGFPETLNLSPQLRVKTHQEYFHAVIFRDLIERHDVAHPKAVYDLAHWLVNNIVSPYSINRLTGYLKSLGHNAPKTAVSNYLSWFQDAFFFFSVRLYDASLAKSHANPKKAYCVDHAMIASLSSGILVNSGHLLENLVFVTLRRTFPEIFYYKSPAGREVDFVVPSRPAPLLVQVCESLADPQTRSRELAALREAMTHLKVHNATLVTRAEKELISTDAGTIHIIPIWAFLLEFPKSTP